MVSIKIFPKMAKVNRFKSQGAQLWLFYLVVFFLLVSAPAEAFDLKGVRQRIPLNAEWSFAGCVDIDETGYSDESLADKWVKIDLPKIQHYAYPFHCAWYRKVFSLNEDFISVEEGGDIRLVFSDVRHLARVYVNGRYAGEHTGGFLPFSFSIGDLLRTGENEIFVGVRDWTSASEEFEKRGDEKAKYTGNYKIKEDEDNIPPVDFAAPVYKGFPKPGTIIFPIGNHGRSGICGDVYIEAIPRIRISGVKIESLLDKKMLRVKVDLDGDLENGKGRIAGGMKDLRLSFWIRDLGVLNEKTPSGNFFKNILNHDFPAGERCLDLDVDFRDGCIWDMDRPYLYELVICLHEDGDKGEILDKIGIRFGFRDFSIKGPYFYFNGHRINLRVANMGYDADTTPESVRAGIRRLKAAHFNLIRFAGQPVPPWMLDACDEEGVLVADESAINGCYVGRYDTSFDSPFWANAREHMRNLLRRDWNHPSVAIWTIENETLEYNAGHGGEVRFVELGMLVKSLDRTRPIMYEGGLDCFGVADIVNIHYAHEYPFWNCLPDDAWWLEQGMERGRHDRDDRDGRADVMDYAHGTDGYESRIWPEREWGRDDGIYLDSLWRWMPDHRFRWDRSKPIFMGEELDIPSMTPDPYSILWADRAYKDWRDSRRGVKALVWQHYIEAYRHADVAGICPFVVKGDEKDGDPLYAACQEAFKPVACFMKEKDMRFWEGEEIERTIAVYNDEMADNLDSHDRKQSGEGRKSKEDGGSYYKYKSNMDKGQGKNAGSFVVEWSLKPQGISGRDDLEKGAVQKGRDVFSLMPGFHKDIRVGFKMPDIGTEEGFKKKMLFQVKVMKNGALRDEKEWAFWGFRKDFVGYGSEIKKISQFDSKITLFDPLNKTGRMLEKMGLSFSKIDWRETMSQEGMPEDGILNLKGSNGETPMNLRFTRGNENNLFCHSGEGRNPGFTDESIKLKGAAGDLLIIGPGGFSCMEGGKIYSGGERPWAKRILRFLEEGGMVLALEQDFLPPWLPLNVTLNKMHDSTVCFGGKGIHPVLNGIDYEGLRFWRGDHIVSRQDINLPVIGDYRSIVDSGGTGGLVYSPMLELGHGKGRMILCQMLLSEKWEKEPIAAILVKNLLEYALKSKERSEKGSDALDADAIDAREGIKKDIIIGIPEIEQEDDKAKKDAAGATTGTGTIRFGGLLCEGSGIRIFEGADGLQGLSLEKDEVMDFVRSGGKVIIRGIDHENLALLSGMLPVRLRKIGRDELPIQVLNGEDIFLYNRDLYWVKPHSEFSKSWAGFDDGIAEFAVEFALESNVMGKDTENNILGKDAGKDDGRFVFKPLTKPGALVKISYGKGYFLMDQVRWDLGGFNAEKGLRYASSILAHTGARFVEGGVPFTDKAVIEVENMSCRTPGQPLNRCHSHDYWTICSADYVSERVKFLSNGRYRIAVRAKSRRHDRIPVMGLQVDIKVIGLIPVPPIYWGIYDFIADIDEGEHEIGLCLLNSKDPYDEQYLYLDRIAIEMYD
ncbi:hypothetical protein JXL19_01615 [bacterium]|nr:hypothetical protein [bacterium]